MVRPPPRPHQVPVCAWPDGRVVRRLDDRGALRFDSAPSPHAPADVEFSFFREGERDLLLPGQLSTAGFDDSTVTEQAGKLAWFVLEVGMAPPADQLPVDLFLSDLGWSRVFEREDGVRRLRLPRFRSGAEIRIWEVPSGAELTSLLTPAALEDLVSRTLPGEEFEARHFVQDGERGASFQLWLPSMLQRRFSVSFRDRVWRIRQGSVVVDGLALGVALLEFMRRRGVLHESEREAWEAELEPGTLLHDDSVFRLLGEVSPLLWPQDRFWEWVSGG